MQFFLLDFALAFVALLAYRALAAVARDGFRPRRPLAGPIPNPPATMGSLGRAGASSRSGKASMAPRVAANDPRIG
jgi:hypothetical protein